MGVLNATPDSFYAGSRTSQVETALRVAEKMIHEGADLLDIGGESTRPGASEISCDREMGRVLPILEALHERWPNVLLSIDTRKAPVALAALRAGCGLINDVSALQHDPAMAEVVGEADCPVV